MTGIIAIPFMVRDVFLENERFLDINISLREKKVMSRKIGTGQKTLWMQKAPRFVAKPKRFLYLRKEVIVTGDIHRRHRIRLCCQNGIRPALERTGEQR